MALYGLQEYENALPLARQALVIMKKFYPIGHPNIKTVQSVVDGIEATIIQK